jgi:hypothetical protein
MGFSVTLEGDKEMIAKVKSFAKTFPLKVEAALYKQGELIMLVAKVEFVPVDTGALRSTGHVMIPVRMGNLIVVMLVFGGPAAPYALKVHEDLRTSHEVGEAKYLEKPMKLAAPTLLKKIAADLQL